MGVKTKSATTGTLPDVANWVRLGAEVANWVALLNAAVPKVVDPDVRAPIGCAPPVSNPRAPTTLAMAHATNSVSAFFI